MKRLAAVAAVLIGIIGLVGAASAHMDMSTPMANGTPGASPMPCQWVRSFSRSRIMASRPIPWWR